MEYLRGTNEKFQEMKKNYCRLSDPIEKISKDEGKFVGYREREKVIQTWEFVKKIIRDMKKIDWDGAKAKTCWKNFKRCE